jgi:hypothetical protein
MSTRELLFFLLLYLSFPLPHALTNPSLFSDYRHQDDEAFASRGSMAVKNCVLKPPAGAEGMRFEIHSGAAGRGGEKW